MFPLTHCSTLTKRRLPALKQQSFFSGSFQERMTQRRGTTGFQQPTRWHRSTLPRRPGGERGRCEWRIRSGEFRHASCMAAFQRGGQLEREARSRLGQVPTDKYCRNAAEYFLTRLRHQTGALDQRVAVMWNRLVHSLKHRCSGAGSQCWFTSH